MFDKIKDFLFRNASEQVRRNADIEYTRECVLRKFPLLGVTMANLKTVPAEKLNGTKLDTAATDGECVYYNPKFFDSLDEQQRIFLYAHEVMHVAFNHILRSKGRNPKIWNQATDAVINQMLMHENLPMIQGGVDIAEAINHSAEEMYEKLLHEQQQKQDNSQNQSDNSSQNNANDESQQAGHDSHQIWDDAVKHHEQQQAREQKSNQKQAADNNDKKQSDQSRGDKSQKQSDKSGGQKPNGKKSSGDETQNRPAGGRGDNGTDNESRRQMNSGDGNVSETGNGDDGRDFSNWSPENESQYEKGFEEHNRARRSEMAVQVQKSLDAAKNRVMDAQISESLRTFGDVGRSSAVVDWRRILKKTLEREQDRWSYRRSDADNDYMARVEEIDDDERAETEVMLDVSGSVSDDFLREFLRQLRPLLKDSKLRVGCFSDRCYPFVDIKNDRDINNFQIPVRGGTNWDIAVKAFTKKQHVNKIIFTDGEMPGLMPDYTTRNVNVIWLVYGREDFNPVCGRVIRVSPAQISRQNFYAQSRDGR